MVRPEEEGHPDQPGAELPWPGRFPGAEHRRSEQKLGGAVGHGGRKRVGHERGLWCFRERKYHEGKRYGKKPNVDFFCEPQIM